MNEGQNGPQKMSPSRRARKKQGLVRNSDCFWLCKLKIDILTDAKPAPLKRSATCLCELLPLNLFIYRDRENCTVFVADLPGDATEDDLKTLFNDVGNFPMSEPYFC